MLRYWLSSVLLEAVEYRVKRMIISVIDHRVSWSDFGGSCVQEISLPVVASEVSKVLVCCLVCRRPELGGVRVANHTLVLACSSQALPSSTPH